MCEISPAVVCLKIQGIFVDDLTFQSACYAVLCFVCYAGILSQNFQIGVEVIKHTFLMIEQLQMTTNDSIIAKNAYTTDL